MYTDEFLKHSGRKGMKWGQHIYGKERMVSRKSKRNFDDHENIYKSLSKKQREYLNGGPDYPTYFVDHLDYYGLYKQKLLKIGKTPMSFVDAWGGKNPENGVVQLTIATNKQHQGRGYGGKALKAMMDDLKLDTKISEIQWFADVTNKNSNKTALSAGFELIDTITYAQNGAKYTDNIYRYKKG